MKDLLTTYYAIQNADKIKLDGREGLQHNEYIYFTIPADNKEIIQMEQAALIYYLLEHNYPHAAVPVRTIDGNWHASMEGHDYMVLRVGHMQEQPSSEHGKLLAAFHQMGANYTYEPQEISSYGQWKQLWINKLTFFEKKVEKDSEDLPSGYYRLLMDVLPYIVGLSENAIQYVQESEQDYRYHEADQGSIAFRRYSYQLKGPVLWMDDLVYDHPARDLAEYVRQNLLQQEATTDELALFFKEYQSIRPLSIFSWRLLYARLLFPVHFFDLLERAFVEKNANQHYTELVKLLEKQSDYEKQLAGFFDIMGVDHEASHIPVLHWL